MKLVAYNKEQFEDIIQKVKDAGLEYEADWLRREIHVSGVEHKHCLRCGHEWSPRDKSKEPVICPKCKSPYWDVPKKN